MSQPTRFVPSMTGTDVPPEGARRLFGGVERVFYNGYWIRTYPIPRDELRAKKDLLEALTRRLFNHTEHGLDVPGSRLDATRLAYESEQDPAKRRVKGAMLAGALFNRATDIFRRLVDLERDGVDIRSDFFLIKECGRCLLEALELGKLVRHRSGEEGIDELWGEPFRLYSSSLQDFCEGRYVRVAFAMRDIDAIASCIAETMGAIASFAGIGPVVAEFAQAAKVRVDTLRGDPDLIDVWTNFVVAGERLVGYQPAAGGVAGTESERHPGVRAHGIEDGKRLLFNGHALMFHIARARTSMPKSTSEFVERAEFYLRSGRLPPMPVGLPG